MDACPYFIGAFNQPRCGGCLLDGSLYEKDVEAKYLTLKKTLSVESGMSGDEINEVLHPPVYLRERQWRYRNSGRFHVRMRDGRPVIGFFSASEPKIVVDITKEGCRLFSSEYLDALLDVREFLVERRVLEDLSRAAGSGSPVISIVVRIPQRSRRKIIALQLSRRTSYNKRDLLRSIARSLRDYLQNRATGAVDVVAMLDPSGRVILTEPEGVLVGFHDPHKLRARGLMPIGLSRIYEDYEIQGGPDRLSLRMYFSPGSFIQNNTFIAELLYGKIVESARELVESLELAVDLYSGVGPIAIALSSIFERVEAVESNRKAVEDAYINLVQNEGVVKRPEGVRFHSKRAEFWFSPYNVRLMGLSGKINALVLDPPPRGIHPLVLEGIRTAKPEYLFYVSCRMGTLAKNLRKLRSIGYKPIRIIPYDMFPQAEHLENLTILKKI